MCIAATRSMSFLVTSAKRISTRKSPPMGVIFMISPSPKAVCLTLSPTAKLAVSTGFGAEGAGKGGVFGGVGVRRGEENVP